MTQCHNCNDLATTTVRVSRTLAALAPFVPESVRVCQRCAVKMASVAATDTPVPPATSAPIGDGVRSWLKGKPAASAPSGGTRVRVPRLPRPIPGGPTPTGATLCDDGLPAVPSRAITASEFAAEGDPSHPAYTLCRTLTRKGLACYIAVAGTAQPILWFLSAQREEVTRIVSVFYSYRFVQSREGWGAVQLLKPESLCDTLFSVEG
jgi:hypothetical protein